MTDDREPFEQARAAGPAKRHERRLAHADLAVIKAAIEEGNARHAAIDALIEAGFVDPDDGTVPRWRDNEPVPVWTVPAQVVDVVLAAALPHLRAHQTQAINQGPELIGDSAVSRETLGRAIGLVVAGLEADDEGTCLEWAYCVTCPNKPGPCACSGEPMAHSKILDAVLALLPTEAETKALAETATKLGYELGRKEAAEDIRVAIERRRLKRRHRWLKSHRWSAEVESAWSIGMSNACSIAYRYARGLAKGTS